MEANKSSFLKFDYNQFNQQNLLCILSRFGNPQKLKILYISTYIPNYTRTETLLDLLRKSEIEVVEALVGNSRLKYFKAVYYLLKYQGVCDLILVGFRGQEILPVLKLLSNKPIIFDAFLSIYDTLCFDRRIFKPDSLIGKCLKSCDKFLCRISDIVLVDTKAHKDYFREQFEVENVDYFYLGCNEKLFRPLKADGGKEEFVVFWYGTVRPLQGIDVILKAAAMLEDKKVKFKMVGPVRKKYSELIAELKLKNTEFIDRVPYEELPVEISKADVCLGGHFSDIDKAQRVIAGKTFQFLACGKAVIVADNPANMELFRGGTLIHFVKANDPCALADKILELKQK